MGVLGFNFKIFKAGGRSSQERSLSFFFPNLKFYLSVILRVSSVLEEVVHVLPNTLFYYDCLGHQRLEILHMMGVEALYS